MICAKEKSAAEKAKERTNAWGDGIVELHEHDESNAPGGADNAESGAERVERLSNLNAAADRGRDVFRQVVFDEARADRITPACVKDHSKQQDVRPISQKSKAEGNKAGKQRS